MSNHNIVIAECSIRAVELIEQGKYSEFTAAVHEIIESKLANIAEYVEDEMCEMDTVGSIKKVFRSEPGKRAGKVSVRLKKMCGKGRKLLNGACVPIVGAEKQHKTIGNIKAQRNKKQQGANFLLKANKKRKRTNLKRTSQGL